MKSGHLKFQDVQILNTESIQTNRNKLCTRGSWLGKSKWNSGSMFSANKIANKFNVKLEYLGTTL